MSRALLVARRILVFSCLFAMAGSAQDKPPYKDAAVPVPQRVADLLGRMTLEEKAAQLGSVWQRFGLQFVDKNGQLDETKAKEALKDGLGQYTRPSETRGPAEMADFTNALQRLVIENTRLGIPVMYHEECLHGHAAPRGTSYPQAIGLAATWDPDLLEQVFAATAQEVRARGAQQCLMPVLDLAVDPRWGRTEETYGEDPYLSGRLGVAAVRGLQGGGQIIDENHVFATLKHFAGHSQPEGGTNAGPVEVSERTLRGVWLVPFEMAIKEAHAGSVMPSYNDVNGIPNHSNNWLLRTLLRDEWGFQGTVVSDYEAIRELATLHRIAPDCRGAAEYALKAGVDMELPATNCYRAIPDLVKSGRISQAMVDESVARVLRAKFDAGLFDRPYADPKRAEAVTNSPEHQALALKAAHETITLLKNKGNLLPLDAAKIKRIAVIGPNAAEPHLGGYSGTPDRAVSILQGIKDKVGKRIDVQYREGCRITENQPVWEQDEAIAADPEKDKARIAEAVKTLSGADLGIVVLGENESTSREAWAANHLGDRDDLNLLGRQDELVKQLLATGKPVVVILLHGRPNSINYIAENVPAILDGWYLGQAGGTAMADVLFGDYNPAGRLPMTVPRSVGQVPDYYYEKPSAKRGYLFANKSPLFPFGYGLSYTTFKYSNVRVTPDSAGVSETMKVSAEITNTGSRAGDEVVQLYVHQPVASVVQPVKRLRGFQRISLKPGETRTVEFPLGPQDLSFYNREMKRVVEPGKFEVMVGPNSNDVTTVILELKP